MTVSNIILIGLPGSGKTTIGRQLAKRLRLPFADSDQAIEQSLGCSISDYFAREGEAAFRDVEERTLARLCEQHRGVLSTGGGAVLRESNRELLRASGHVVYLRSSPEALAQRLRHDTSRPLLQVADPLVKLRSLYDARDPLYRSTAHSVLDTSRPALGALMDKLLAQLERSGAWPQG